MSTIRQYKRELLDAIEAIRVEEVERVAQRILDVTMSGGVIFIAGNGGSAAISSHFACDLGKGCTIPGKKSINVHSLTDNTPWITAISNDFSYEEVFVKQLENFLGPKDLLLVISSSGNSENIVKALSYARQVGAYTVALIGFSGGRSKDLADDHIFIDSMVYGVVEDCHSILEHMITTEIKLRLTELVS